LATARAAAALGSPLVASTNSHFTLEEIAEASGDAPRWFQLYWPNDRDLAESFVKRAEAAGYAAIVLTVDTFIPGWKPRDLQQAWLPFLNGMGVANYFQDPVFPRRPGEDPRGRPGRRDRPLPRRPGQPVAELGRPRVAARLRPSLPIVIKGIQHVDDAREAAQRGIDGIVVSNHGGVRSTAALASLDALEPIAEAVGDEIAVSSTAASAAAPTRSRRFALGADAVCLGRPYVWGLALDGQAGVETVLKMVLAELDLTMALCGYTRPSRARPGRTRLGRRLDLGEERRHALVFWPPGASPGRPGRATPRPAPPVSCSLVRGR